MAQAHPALVPIRFGVFEVDPRAGELRKQGVKVKLQEQPFQILQALLERPGELVTREELRQRIWPADTFVDFDAGLNNAIKRLRDALGDSAENPRFVETLPKRGYRFIGAVNGTHLATPDTKRFADRGEDSVRSRRGLRVGLGMGLGAGVLLIALLGLVPLASWRRLSGKSSIPQIRSIAVLPLQSLSTDPSQEYFAEGMTDALITDLAQVSALKVVSRTTIMRYGRPDKPLPQIARELNVDGIVEGTVQRSGDRVRITAQLIYGPADQHLWARRFERDVKDMLGVQSTIASDIAKEIQVKVTSAEQARLKNIRPVNPKALDAYIEARFHIDQANRLEYYKDKQQAVLEELRKAVAYLDHALQEDPNYLPAYAAFWNVIDVANVPRLEFLPRAKAALTKALELDENNVEAHLALARLLMQYEYDWAGADREFKRAIQINPNSADAHDQYAGYFDNVEGGLDNTGDTNDAKRERELAQALDPAHDYYFSCCNPERGPVRIGMTLEEEAKAIDEKGPDDPSLNALLGKDYAIHGMYKESVQRWERCVGLYGWHEFVNVLKEAEAKGGSKFALEEWMRAGEERQRKHFDMPVVAMAFTYSSLGNKDRAFAWLDKAVEQRNWIIIYLKRDNVWDPLRSDPRFGALLHRVGLPP